SCWRWWWLRPQFRDEPQNLLEHLPWDGDLAHLEGDIAAVAHDLRADLDSACPWRRARAAPASRASAPAPAPACTDIDSAGDGLRAFEPGRHSGDQEQEIVNAPKGLHIWFARDM